MQNNPNPAVNRPESVAQQGRQASEYIYQAATIAAALLLLLTVAVV